MCIYIYVRKYTQTHVLLRCGCVIAKQARAYKRNHPRRCFCGGWINSRRSLYLLMSLLPHSQEGRRLPPLRALARTGLVAVPYLSLSLALSLSPGLGTSQGGDPVAPSVSVSVSLSLSLALSARKLSCCMLCCYFVPGFRLETQDFCNP